MADEHDALELFHDDPSEENEDDLSMGKPEEGIGTAVVTGTDWTTETILSQLERGNIELSPRFQRRDAWREVRKSRFIESLVLGLPVPQLVLAERLDKRGTYLVIDGKQRLLALRQFAADEGGEFSRLALRGLEVRTDLNGKYFADLRGDSNFENEVREFENQTIRTVVVRAWPDEDFLFRVFLRLNTGSVPLSPQELRQALHPGHFVDFADDFSGKSQPIQEALGIKKPDFRMRDVELLIRFFAFEWFLEDYTGNLKAFLDMTCKSLNSAWATQEQDILESAVGCELAISTTIEIFGTNAFRRFTKDGYENRFNRAVFDVMTYYFSDDEIAALALKNSEAVEEAYQSLSRRSKPFDEATSSTTKSLGATQQRLASWGASLSRAIDLELSTPSLVNDRIVLPD